VLGDAATHRHGRLAVVAFRLGVTRVSGHHRIPVMTAHLTGGESQGADGIAEKGDRHV
jgi:hypothetical protein